MKDEEMAENYCNHLQSEMLAYTPENPRRQRTVTLLDVEEAFLAGLKAGRQEEKLTKAIGIIKRWYETNRSACIEPSQELIEVTEQFLSEVEK